MVSCQDEVGFGMGLPIKDRRQTPNCVDKPARVAKLLTFCPNLHDQDAPTLQLASDLRIVRRADFLNRFLMSIVEPFQMTVFPLATAAVAEPLPPDAAATTAVGISASGGARVELSGFEDDDNVDEDDDDNLDDDDDEEDVDAPPPGDKDEDDLDTFDDIDDEDFDDDFDDDFEEELDDDYELDLDDDIPTEFGGAGFDSDDDSDDLLDDVDDLDDLA